MSQLAVVKGLLFSPAATMWRLREKGSLFMSLAAAWILGGFGFHQTHILDAITGHTQPLWLGWATAAAFFPLAFTASMVAYHAAGMLVWRGGPDPVKPATLGDMLRLGGYMALPSTLIGLTSNLVVGLAVLSGSAAIARAVFLGLVPVSVAALIWSLIYVLRLLRTVYLTSWGNGVAIWLIGGIIAAALSAAGLGSASAPLDFAYHIAHGADPETIEVARSLPSSSGGGSFGTRAGVYVVRLRGEPRTGDLVAFYADREAPRVPSIGSLPGPVRVGRVLAVGGQAVVGDAGGRLSVDAAEVGWAAGQVVMDAGQAAIPPGQVAILPDDLVGPFDLESCLVPRSCVAGLVPEACRAVHLLTSWLLR